MKRVAFAFAIVAAFTACTDPSSQQDNPTGDSTAPGITTLGGSGDSNAAFIQKDTANKMIRSYLTSVGAPGNDSNLRSLILDASSLRSYLNTDPEGKKITKMKVMFAHTQSYINAGNTGRNCGYKSGALTVVLAGYDSAGNYVLYPGNMVMDRAVPCPSNCPSVGSASSDLILE